MIRLFVASVALWACVARAEPITGPYVLQPPLTAPDLAISDSWIRIDPTIKPQLDRIEKMLQTLSGRTAIKIGQIHVRRNSDNAERVLAVVAYGQGAKAPGSEDFCFGTVCQVSQWEKNGSPAMFQPTAANQPRLDIFLEGLMP